MINSWNLADKPGRMNNHPPLLYLAGEVGIHNQGLWLMDQEQIPDNRPTLEILYYHFNQTKNL